MSTRSNIAYEEDGVVKVAFCRQDGYLDHTGRMLFDHYNSFEKAKELVDLGSYQSIKPDVESIGKNSGSLSHHLNTRTDTYRSIRSYMYHVDAQEIEYIYMWEKKMWWFAQSVALNTWEEPEQGYLQFVCYHSKFESLGSELAHWDYDNPTDEQGAYV